jgi:quercetin dioxygenase-like cupin family protein
VKPSRRDLGLVLPALAAATASAQETKRLPSKAYRFEDLPVKVNGKNKARAVLNGELHSGFPLELHMTELAAGEAPHPPHHHVHEELLLLQQGMLDATINGQTTHVAAGSVLFLASNDEHGWRNPGPGAAQYFVIALGRDDA